MSNQNLKLLLENKVNKNEILQYLYNDDIVSSLASYQIVNIIKKLDDKEKKDLLYNKEFLEKYKISQFDIRSIIEGLNDETKSEILYDVNFIKKDLQFSDWQVVQLAKTISSEESKSKLIDIYKFTNHFKTEIITTFSSERKTELLLADEDINIITTLKSFKVEELVNFFQNNKEFCLKKAIHPCEIIRELRVKDQQYLVENIEELNLSLNEKREIFASLREETKSSIDVDNIPKEYKTALSVQCNEYTGYVMLDFNKNIEDYKGLDNLIRINPEQFNKQEKDYFIKLCDVCPKLQVVSILNEVEESISTANEYKDAEEWITSLINNLNPEYTKLQKMAVIDNAIGKKISYSPDFDTEIYNSSDSRALWKIISSGYGVCNGISKVEQYILKQVGIESKIVSSETHAFLKIEDVQILNEDGVIENGNTIIDPTWNLTKQRFGGKPDYFCVNYEEARKGDVGTYGNDYNCHKNDELLNDATLKLDEKSLRSLYTSVGLADKDGKFPVKELIENSKLLHECFANDTEKNINKQLLLLSKYCPDFAECPQSSMSILSDTLLANENLKFNKCVVNRVYNKTDKEKRPVMYVYVDSNDVGKKFYFANKEERKFEQLSQEGFTSKFECYEEDLKNSKGIRPWENVENKIEKIDLTKNSGYKVAMEGEER